MRKINFLNIPIDAFTKQETFQKVENTILLKKQIHHTVVNSGKIVLMQTDKGLAKSIVESDISLYKVTNSTFTIESKSKEDKPTSSKIFKKLKCIGKVRYTLKAKK